MARVGASSGGAPERVRRSERPSSASRVLPSVSQTPPAHCRLLQGERTRRKEPDGEMGEDGEGDAEGLRPRRPPQAPAPQRPRRARHQRLPEPAAGTANADNERVGASERSPVRGVFHFVINRKERVGQRETGYLEQNLYSPTVLEIKKINRKEKESF